MVISSPIQHEGISFARSKRNYAGVTQNSIQVDRSYHIAVEVGGQRYELCGQRRQHLSRRLMCGMHRVHIMCGIYRDAHHL